MYKQIKRFIIIHDETKSITNYLFGKKQDKNKQTKQGHLLSSYQFLMKMGIKTIENHGQTKPQEITPREIQI